MSTTCFGHISRAIALMLCLCMTARGQTLPSTRPACDIHPLATLVKGEVVVVTDTHNGFHSEAKLKVTHVYCGSGISIGSEFDGVYAEAHSVGNYLRNRPKVGAVGLFIVDGTGDHAWTGEGSYFLDDRFSALNLEFADAIEGISPRYKEHEALADAIEAVVRVDQKEGTALLWQVLYSKTPEISAWAAVALTDADPDGLRKVAGDVEKIKKVPLAGQLGLDLGMAALEEGWVSSQDRKTMVANWRVAPADESETSLTRWRRSEKLDHADLNVDFVIGLFKQDALQDGIGREMAYRCVLQIGRISQTHRPDGRAEAKAALEEIVRDSKYQSIKDAAHNELARIR